MPKNASNVLVETQCFASHRDDGFYFIYTIRKKCFDFALVNVALLHRR